MDVRQFGVKALWLACRSEWLQRGCLSVERESRAGAEGKIGSIMRSSSLNGRGRAHRAPAERLPRPHADDAFFGPLPKSIGRSAQIDAAAKTDALHSVRMPNPQRLAPRA